MHFVGLSLITRELVQGPEHVLQWQAETKFRTEVFPKVSKKYQSTELETPEQ
jgi:hypothetical protein